MPPTASLIAPTRRARPDDERISSALYGSHVAGSPAPEIFRCIYDALCVLAILHVEREELES